MSKQLSVIILSYNTVNTTKECLDALVASLSEYPTFQAEIIVVDNASEDGSKDMIKEYKKSFESDHVLFTSISNIDNEGFPKGNNRGLHNASGEYILFMNSDVIVGSLNWPSIVQYLEKNKNIGALTVRVQLPSKRIDLASHRGFPSLWNSFTYFIQLERLTYIIPQLGRVFGGYHLTHYNFNTIHKVDAISGAFFMAPKKVLDEMDGFDEEFFMYGEDVDLAYRMKEKGYDVVYYPKFTVTHLKYQSGFKNKKAHHKTKEYYHNAMRIFYRKHYADKHSSMVNSFVYLFIDIKSKI